MSSFALFACAVCFSMTDKNRAAYQITTAFLSLMPLGAIFGLAWWTFRRILRAEPDFFAERPDPVEADAVEAEVAPPRLVVARD